MTTIKQKKALSLIMENNGNVSKSMRQAGYSDNYASNPQTLVASKGFQRLVAAMDEMSRRKYGLDSDIKAVEVYTDAMAAEKSDMTGQTYPDHKTRMDAADRVLEVQGMKGEPQQQTNIQVNVTRGE